MSDILFKKNKIKYFFILLLLLMLITFLLCFGILWMSNPSKYVFWLLPNSIIVFLFSILSVLSSLVLLYITIKSVFNREFFIRINEKGLFLGIIQYSNKLIYWKNITRIEVVEINNTKHIIIYINNIEYYKNKEKGIEKYFFMSRIKRYGTPYVINTNALSANINEIAQSMIENWEKFK